jgi:putative FmdB family regulatory protein
MHDRRGMPTYEFHCRACGESFELTMHVDEYDRVRGRGLECPKCKSREIEPEIAPFEVQTPSKTL